MYDTENSHPLSQLIREEDGSVTFISLVVVLGMAVLIGFLGNMASETIDRQKLQNAADATAYSSAVWMARGMNTISTCNHIMGELTAMVVIIEALGGPQAEGDDFSAWEIKSTGNSLVKPEFQFNVQLEIGLITAPELFNIVDDFERVYDFVDLLVNDHEEHSCGAAIYDAEVNLKMHGVICLTGKQIGNILEALFWIPFGIGTVLKEAGELLHMVMNVYMKWITVETKVVRAMESAVSKIAKVKKPLRIIIRVMDLTSRPVPNGFRSFLSQNDRYYQGRYSLALLKTSSYGLPVELETWSDQDSDDTAYYAHPWSGSGVDAFIGSISGSISKASSSLSALPFWMKKKKKKAKNKINGGKDKLNSATQFLNTPGWDGNPSIDTLSDMDPEYELNTQWVRGTYPYVDLYRTPLRNMFVPLVLSEMNTFFTAWTYRYTINESFDLHNSGRRMWVMADSTKDDKGSEQWITDSTKAEEYFSVATVAQVQYHVPVFSASFYKKASTKEGAVAVSQAMFYNRNGLGKNINAVPDFEETPNQPNTGWDTLQWDPGSPIEDGGEIVAQEWTSMDPAGGDLSGMISSISSLIGGIQSGTSTDDGSNATDGIIGSVSKSFLTDAFTLSATKRNKVKLNWQAKMRPVHVNSLSRLANQELSSVKNAGHAETILRHIIDNEKNGGLLVH